MEQFLADETVVAVVVGKVDIVAAASIDAADTEIVAVVVEG